MNVEHSFTEFGIKEKDRKSRESCLCVFAVERRLRAPWKHLALARSRDFSVQRDRTKQVREDEEALWEGEEQK